MGSLRSMRKVEKPEIKKPEVEVCNVPNPQPFTATVTNYSGPTTTNSYVVYVDSSNVATSYNFWVYNTSSTAWMGVKV